MGDRYYLWVAARLLAGVAIVAWAASYLGSGSGEKEFQKTLDAMKQVRSFRVAFSSVNDVQDNVMLWEVDCNKDILHHHWHVTRKADPPSELDFDQTYVSGKEFDRKSDGTWVPSKGASILERSQYYCKELAEGTDTGLLPEIATMIKRGVIQKGDKKTVNGVRCREWKVTMKGGIRGLEHDTICIGLEDRLPYERVVDWDGSRTTFSDYNTAIHIDVPEAAVQPASAQSMESN